MNNKKRYNDKTAHNQPPLVAVQTMRLFDHKNVKWQLTTVLAKCAERDPTLSNSQTNLQRKETEFK